MRYKTLSLPLMIFLCLSVYRGYCQSLSFDTLLNRGKAVFKKDFNNQDYAYAIENLSQAVALKPDNAEARYFLAYSYSRFNSNGSAAMDKMKLPLVIKASEQLQAVIKISPLYTGENIVLDPYSKLTSEWGSMAMAYYANNKTDSAIWALKEGRLRGGFDDFILSECRIVLKACKPNSILVSYGDNYFFPFLYLQLVEKLRTDIAVVETGLLSTNWYAKLLVQKKTVTFDLKQPERDTIDYQKWSDSTISIPIEGTGRSFTWIVKPSYEKEYLLRNNRLLLSLLKENKFKRDVYFTMGFGEEDSLGLLDHLLELPVVGKVDASNEQVSDAKGFIAQLKQLLPELKPANKNSPDEALPVEYFRRNIAKQIENSLNSNDEIHAAAFFKLLNQYLPEKDYPYYTDYIKNRLEELQEEMK